MYTLPSDTVKQVRQLQKMPLKQAVSVIQTMCLTAFLDGLHQGESYYDDAMILYVDEETAEHIREEVSEKNKL